MTPRERAGIMSIALLLAVVGFLIGGVPFAMAQSQPISVAQLGFDDELDGSALDTSQWTAMNRGGDTINNSEVQCYLPSNVTESHGFLSISTNSDPAGCASIGTGYQYSSGMVQWTSYNFTYGTIEVRASMSGGTGSWPLEHPMSPAEQVVLERCLAPARVCLGEAATVQAWKAGQALSTQQAIQCARALS